MNIKECVIIDYYYEPTFDVFNFIKKLGYDEINYNNFDLMFNEEFVEFIKQKCTYDLWGENVCIGEKGYKFRVGFAGTCRIRKVDIDREWNIKYDNKGIPSINYVKVEKNKYGYVGIR